MSFLENLEWRYATKKFDGSKITEDKVQQIKDSIRLCPSSFGVQPYHVVFVENKNTLEVLKKYSKRNELQLETCSHLLVFCARMDLQKRFEQIEKIQGREKGILSKVGFIFQHFIFIFNIMFGRVFTKKSWGSAQTYLALGFAMAACTELKVDSSPLEGFNSTKFKKTLKLPRHVHPVVLLAVGNRSSEDKVYPKARFAEADLFTQIK